MKFVLDAFWVAVPQLATRVPIHDLRSSACQLNDDKARISIDYANDTLLWIAKKNAEKKVEVEVDAKVDCEQLVRICSGQ